MLIVIGTVARGPNVTIRSVPVSRFRRWICQAMPSVDESASMLE